MTFGMALTITNMIYEYATKIVFIYFDIFNWFSFNIFTLHTLLLSLRFLYIYLFLWSD